MMRLTVKDLIAKLLEYPMDATVFVKQMGDLTPIHEEDLTLDEDNDLIINP